MTKREWDRNRSFVRIRFRRPTSAQLSRAVKADEISVVDPLNHCVLLDNLETIERLGLLSQPLLYLIDPLEIHFLSSDRSCAVFS